MNWREVSQAKLGITANRSVREQLIIALAESIAGHQATKLVDVLSTSDELGGAADRPTRPVNRWFNCGNDPARDFRQRLRAISFASI